MEKALVSVLQKYNNIIKSSSNLPEEFVKTAEEIQKLSRLLHGLFFEEFKTLVGDEFLDNYQEAMKESEAIHKKTKVEIIDGQLSLTDLNQKVELRTARELVGYLLAEKPSEDTLSLMDLFCLEKEAFINLNITLANLNA